MFRHCFHQAMVFTGRVSIRRQHRLMKTSSITVKESRFKPIRQNREITINFVLVIQMKILVNLIICGKYLVDGGQSLAPLRHTSHTVDKQAWQVYLLKKQRRGQ